MARPREFNETEALDRAVDVFWERGFEGTSIADLESATGLGRQSLYNAFGGKRELFLRALDRYAERNAAQDVGPLGSGLDALEGFLLESVAFLSEGGRGCFMTKALLEDPKADDVSSRCGVRRDRVHDLAAMWIGEAVDAGEARTGLDVAMAARLVSTHAHGVSAAAAAGADPEDLARGVRWLVDSFRSTPAA